jgi:hypothetical protein
MDAIGLYATIFTILCVVLVAGVRFKRITVRLASVVVLVLSYIGYGFIEYSWGIKNLGLIVCMGSILFATIGIPTIFVCLALEKWPSKQYSKKE